MENLISDDLDSMKNLCLDLREHATKLINYGKKKNDDLVMMMTIKNIIETEIIAFIQENKKSCS